jgi:hypothetical protein
VVRAVVSAVPEVRLGVVASAAALWAREHGVN